MIVFTNPRKFPWLSGVATLGAGIGGTSIYGLVLYDLSIVVGLLGALIGISTMFISNYFAEQKEKNHYQLNQEAANTKK
jgi:hypothetical protein